MLQKTTPKLNVCNLADLGRAGWPAQLQAAAVGVGLFQVSLILPLRHILFMGNGRSPRRKVKMHKVSFKAQA